MAVRRAIQSSQESLIALAERYDINPKTVHKWSKRFFVSDAANGLYQEAIWHQFIDILQVAQNSGMPPSEVPMGVGVFG